MKPEELKTNLARASAFLAAYELLKSSIVNKPRGFFILHHTYKTEVVSLKRKDRFRASCLWFLKLGAISEQDLRVIEDIRHHRNEIAHELPKYLMDAEYEVNMQLLESIAYLLGKVDRRWIREIEIPTNPDFDGKEPENIPDHEINSGSMLAIDLILKIIHGQEEEVAEMYPRFLQVWEVWKSLKSRMRGSSSSRGPGTENADASR
jgi:hypothetical protein